MNKLYKIIYAVGALVIIGVGINSNRKMTKAVKLRAVQTKMSENAFNKSQVATVNNTHADESNAQIFDVMDLSGFEDPNLGKVQLVKHEFAVADNAENRTKFPHGTAFAGFWRVAQLPNQNFPPDGMFLIRAKNQIKIASGLFSVKLKDFVADEDRNFFKGAVIYKKRPEISVVVYKFQKFEDMIQARNDAKNISEILRSDIEILTRARFAN